MFDLALYQHCIVGDVSTEMVSAITQQESNGDFAAFNVNGWKGKRYTANSMEQAIVLSEIFVEEGFTVDVGLMGINSANLKRYQISIRGAFDPCTNIKIGTYIYSEYLKTTVRKGEIGEQAMQVALSIYNTGSRTRGFKNGYVAKVWSIYKGVNPRSYHDSSARESSLSINLLSNPSDGAIR